MPLLEKIGRLLARNLSQERDETAPQTTCHPKFLYQTIQPGDVLLVEGNSGFSMAIKYLTQSSWSHAALYVGDASETPSPPNEKTNALVEADVIEGVRAVPLSKYQFVHTRICRPVGITSEDINKVIRYAVSRIGHRYDLRNIVDLARYLIKTPPVPTRYRRRMLALGSGDPTRAICSSLIAEAFQSVRYPILPEMEAVKHKDRIYATCRNEIFHIRHHSLFAPRDFDVSPYFQVVKPTLESGFDPYAVNWGDSDQRV
jgi:hypothetical protein